MATVAPTVNPVQGLAVQITTGGQPVAVAPANVNGGLIVNPFSNTDQGLATAEILYLDIVGTCNVLVANGTIVALQPGQSFNLVPGQSTMTYVNAVTAGHKFTAIYW